jgi:two-component system, NarL family, sensor kinase
MTEGEILITVVISTLIILLLIVGIIASILAITRQRSRQQAELAQTRLSYEQELRRIESEIGEQLMVQFARELHDNIGHILTCMRLEVENKKLDHPGFGPLILPLEGYLDEASGQLRLLSRSFNTDYVTHIGLVSAISLEVERQRQLRKFTIDWQFDDGPPALDKNQELIVFRIIQEVFQNAIRHSRARQLHVVLRTSPFQLHVQDDGKGFDVAATLRSAGASGLKNILRRCELAGLSCDLQAAPDQGCRYTLTKLQVPHDA